MRCLWSAALLFVSIPPIFAQPGIAQNGVVNLASQIAPTLPGGAIARGALFTIRGVRLGAAGHTTLALIQSEVSTSIPLLSVQARRIQALMPATAPLGSGGLIVTVDGQASRRFPIEVSPFNPGIFSRNGAGWGPGRIDNISGSGALSPNSTSNPAHLGQRASLVVSGLGDASAATLVVGNRRTRATAQRETRQPGEETLNFVVPAGVPLGCFVPVYLEASPGRASNVVTMAIASKAKPCDPGVVPLLPPDRIGIVALSRTRIKARRKNIADEVLDDARITFNAVQAEPAISPTRLLPPPGTCTNYTSSFQADTDLSTSLATILGPGGQGLDAGEKLTLSGPSGTRSIGEAWRNPGNYREHLGIAGLDRRSPGLFLEPGDYVLEGAGGKDVGAFRVAFHLPAPFDWIDRDTTSTVERSRGVTLHWRGASSGQLMVIVARNVDQLTTAIGMTLCVARASEGQFTIPAEMLANIPLSRDFPGPPFDELVIGALPQRVPDIHAAGINGGFIISMYANGRIVDYR